MCWDFWCGILTEISEWVAMWQALFHVSSARGGLSGQIEGSVGLQVKHLPLEVNFCKRGGVGGADECLAALGGWSSPPLMTSLTTWVTEHQHHNYAAPTEVVITKIQTLAFGVQGSMRLHGSEVGAPRGGAVASQHRQWDVLHVVVERAGCNRVKRAAATSVSPTVHQCEIGRARRRWPHLQRAHSGSLERPS